MLAQSASGRPRPATYADLAPKRIATTVVHQTIAGALHLSEHAAYGRIEAARAARRFPAILDHLANGSLTLTTVCLLAPHMTDTNHRDLLTSAWRKSKREVEHLIARLHPLPDVPPSVRKLPTPSVESPLPKLLLQADSSSSPLAHVPISAKRPAVIAPLAQERYKLQVTVGRETHDKLQRARDLLRHRIPSGDLEEILNRALTLLIADAERSKYAAADRPQPTKARCQHTRYIPSAVRPAVWHRDGGCCAFVGTEGRCAERGFLEFHHRVPFANGGLSTVENLSLAVAPTTSTRRKASSDRVRSSVAKVGPSTVQD
jgi:5-methylcytosine-specific restriction endonuclease McrA